MSGAATSGVDVFELGSEHEQVVFCNDRATGLKAIVAIHSTALGPALGGTRFYPYASTDDAIEDVLNLSRGMSYKAALAVLCDLDVAKARGAAAEYGFTRACATIDEVFAGRDVSAVVSVMPMPAILPVL